MAILVSLDASRLLLNRYRKRSPDHKKLALEENTVVLGDSSESSSSAVNQVDSASESPKMDAGSEDEHESS
jgi:hypothetical protein